MMSINDEYAVSMLKKWLADSELEANLRADNPVGWEAAWQALPYQPVGYSASMIDYQHAYFRGAGWSVCDASLVLLNDGRPCGLWHLTLGGINETRLTSSGIAIAAPEFVSGLSPRTIKKICTRALNFIERACSQLQQSPIEIEQCPEMGLSEKGVSDWHQQLMTRGATVSVRHDLYTDLSPSLADIRVGFRKSFRPLISSGLKAWAVSLMNEKLPDDAVWAEFKDLHREVSGRITRSEETWKLQFDMVVRGQAFLVYLRDPQNERMVGGGFFQCTRDEGLYAVGAYDRELFDKPIGHVVQHRAVEEFKVEGLKWYRIGERSFASDFPSATDKQLAIANFKQGFASHIVCRYVFSIGDMSSGKGSVGREVDDMPLVTSSLIPNV